MSFFDIFTTGSKAAETVSDIAKKTTEGIISGLDNRKFTDEERSAMAKQVLDQFLPMWADLQKTLATESSISGLSRRYLAFMILGVFLTLILSSTVVYRIDPKWAEFIVKEGVDRMEFLAGGVGLTYFVYYGVTKFFGAKQA